MEKLSMCRICLVENVRMCVVTNKSLQQMYEKLTDVPFVTEDRKPMLACLFCCTRLQQCCQLQRKCVEAEQLLAHMLSEDYEGKPLTNRAHLESVSGFITSPIVNISIVDDCQTASDAVKQARPAVCEEQDGIELLPARHSEELDPLDMDNSHPDVEAHYTESEPEEDQQHVREIKVEGEEYESSEIPRVREKEKYKNRTRNSRSMPNDSENSKVPIKITRTFKNTKNSLNFKNDVPLPSNDTTDTTADAELPSNIHKSKKRKTITTTLQKSAKKIKRNQEKYYIRPPCHNLCKKLCSLNFCEEKRQSIHAHYWSMDWEYRGIFLKNLVHSFECTKTKAKTKKTRMLTHKYHFYDNDKGKIEVCKTFFLATLGYDKKNDRRVLTAIGKEIANQKDKRDGRNLKVTLVDKDLLTKHVNSFIPSDYYRGVTTPSVKYLPKGLTITMMHENFVKEHPETKCCFETYRNHVSNVMNISYSRLGQK